LEGDHLNPYLKQTTLTLWTPINSWRNVLHPSTYIQVGNQIAQLFTQNTLAPILRLHNLEIPLHNPQITHTPQGPAIQAHVGKYRTTELRIQRKTPHTTQTHLIQNNQHKPQPITHIEYNQQTDVLTLHTQQEENRLILHGEPGNVDVDLKNACLTPSATLYKLIHHGAATRDSHLTGAVGEQLAAHIAHKLGFYIQVIANGGYHPPIADLDLHKNGQTTPCEVRIRTLPHNTYTPRNIQSIFDTQLNPGSDPQNPTAHDRLKHTFNKPRYSNSKWGLIILETLEIETGLTHFLIADVDRHGNTYTAYTPTFCQHTPNNRRKRIHGNSTTQEM